MTIGLLTHWDLDGVLSEYFIRKVYNITFSKAQGYGKIHQNAIKLYETGVTDLIITDLTPTPETLKYCLEKFDSVLLLDHHQETESYKKLESISKKFTLCYSNKMCGAAVVYQHIKDKVKLNSREKKLLQLCDIYDMWRDTRPKEQWLMAHALNDLFWYYSSLEFWGMLPMLDSIDMDNLTEEQLAITKEKVISRKKTIDEAISVMVQSGSIITLLPDKEGVNYVSELIDYSQFQDESNGLFYNIYKNTSDSPYLCSVRSTGKLPNVNIGKTISKLPNQTDIVANAGGHELAGGMEFTPSDIYVIIDYIEESLDKAVLNGK